MNVLQRWLPVGAALILSSTPAWAAPLHPHHDPAAVEAHLQEAFDAAGATPEQRETALEKIRSAFQDLREIHQEHHALRQEMVQVFLGSETIDRLAVEDLRLQAIGLFDRTSALALDWAVDIAEVFTVEQRVKLNDFREAHRWGPPSPRAE